MAGLLADYGVTAVFGVPGGRLCRSTTEFWMRGTGIRHILMKDEIDATFAADARRSSAAVSEYATPPPVRCHQFISGLAEAYNTSIPVIAIGSEMEGDWLPPGTAVRAPKW